MLFIPAFSHVSIRIAIARISHKEKEKKVKNRENVYVENISTVIKYDPINNRLYTKAVQICKRKQTPSNSKFSGWDQDNRVE